MQFFLVAMGASFLYYVVSAALDAGTALMGVLIFFTLQNAGHNLKRWGSEMDHCSLATYPIAPGI